MKHTLTISLDGDGWRIAIDAKNAVTFTQANSHKEKTMKKLTQTLVAAFAVIALTGAIQAAEPQTFCKPNDLRCESQSSPMGVDAVKPRLSWKLDDTG